MSESRAGIPVVALVGRPNVGKSTLFNRLVGGKSAIVHDRPGVTRDRHYGDCEVNGRPYILIDTGGFDPGSDDPMRKGIKRQIDLAIDEADLIICVLDAVEPPTVTDHAELRLLRESGKPVIYVANKADNPGGELEASELYRLGMDELLALSALHGRNIDDLRDAIASKLPKEVEPDPFAAEEDEATAALKPLRVAIVGKPNAGKSSLVNKLLGEERMLVDDRPGTTRDPIDTEVEKDGRKYCLIDTAGIRRRSKVRKEYDYVEAVSVIQAMRAMERAEVVLLLCDAAEGVAEQDAKILGLAVDRGRAIVVGLNKTDQMDKKELAKAEEDARDKLSFIPWAPVIKLSAKTGRGVGQVLETVAKVADAYRKRVGTGELNRFFEQVLANRPPPTSGGRAPRIYYVTQAESAPPLFVVQSSDPESIHFSYQRYVINQIRKAFGFEGVPVKVRYKKRRRRGDDENAEGNAADKNFSKKSFAKKTTASRPARPERGEDGSRPVTKGRAMRPDMAARVEKAARLEKAARPTKSPRAAEPGETRARPAAKRARPAEERAKPAAKRARPAEERAKPAAKRARPAAKRAKPAEKRAGRSRP